MKKLIWFAAATLALAACDNTVNGTMKVTHAFQVKNRNGDMITVAAGSYASALTMKNNQTLDVTFKLNGTNQDVRLKLPKGASLPTDGNGQFVIKGDDVGMPFDTKGTLKTVVTNGAQQHGYTTCQILQPPQQNCFPLPQGGVACTPMPPQQGIMDVVYHLQTTTTDASASFTAVSNGGDLATFAGSNTETVEVDDYQGPCRF